MPFLAKLFAWFGPTLLNWLRELVVEVFQKWQKARQAKKEIEDKNAKVREETEKAQTEEERKRAAEGVFRNF